MPVSNKFDFKKLKSIFFFSLIVIFGVTSLYIIGPFSYPIFWAAILAVTFRPMYLAIHRHLKNRSLSAGLTVMATVLIIFIPLFILATIVINESVILYNHVTEGGFFVKLEQGADQLRTLPHIGQYIGPQLETTLSNWQVYATDVAKDVSTYLAKNLGNIIQVPLYFLLMFAIMLYALFYFLKDGKRFLQRLMHLSPLGDEYETMLYDRFTSTARATLKGTFIVGAVQGTLGGLLFWAVGIEGAFVWGFIMTFLSVIPTGGAAIVWLPAGIIMLALGNIWQGVAILLIGTLVISLIDNLLRPPLVGRDTQMHPLLVLLSTLGGISIFGLSGFIIGPVIVALFLSVMAIYDHYYQRELNNNG